MRSALPTLPLRMNLPTSQEQTGFTLVELSVILMIAAILAALLWPAIKSQIQKAQGAQCIHNLRQLYVGVMGYAADHSMETPVDRGNSSTGTSWYGALTPYVPHGGYGKKRPPYFCPSNPVKITASGSTGWSNYAINGNFMLVETRANVEGKDDPDYRDKRKAMRFPQIHGVKALLLDAYNGNAASPATWYKNSGSRYSNPWSDTHAVHAGCVNVLFTDGHVESPRVEPRPETLRIGGDLVELKAEWFWPLTQ